MNLIGHFFMGFSFLGLLIMAPMVCVALGKALADESHKLTKRIDK
jgi:hypothetical protein